MKARQYVTPETLTFEEHLLSLHMEMLARSDAYHRPDEKNIRPRKQPATGLYFNPELV